MGSIQFSNLGGKTIVEVSKFWEGVNEIVSVISGAIFGFLPVGITWSVSRKMGTSQILGIVLGICLVHPSLLSAYEYAAHKAAGDVHTLSLVLKSWLPRTSYSSTLGWFDTLLS